MNLKKVSFGGPAGIITNMALIMGLNSASVSKSSIITSLLIVGIADNLTDSVSVHIYQEAEKLEPTAAFTVTVANFFTRITISLSFVLQIYFLSLKTATITSLCWGLFLLCLLTFLIARQRKVSILTEIVKHLLGTAIVVLLAKGIGLWISSEVGLVH
ncbi:MAG: hypothetical protein ACXWQ4_15350 [Bdellovibrio sp.]